MEGLRICWLKSYPFKTQLSASYSVTPCLIQQLFIHSLNHLFRPYLKPVRSQKLCQALGYRS